MPRIPLVHVTDLYHPPQDPDDHLDLATAGGLPELDLRAVILDCTRRFLDPAPAGFDLRRDPGFAPVVQFGYLLGRPLPCAIGPTTPLTHPGDDARDRSPHEQAGIDLLLQVLEDSPEPVLISSVGSVRPLTAAFNRAPELLRAKTRAVLLNAGSLGGPKREWNVGLDPAAYIGLWRSGLPLHWYPCATDQGAFDPEHPRGTFWKARHEHLFRDTSPSFRAWITYACTGSARGDLIGALAELGKGAVWENVLAGSRNLWSTASLVMAAGRTLAHTADGWRFLSGDAPSARESWPWRLDPIVANIDDEARVSWQETKDPSPHALFGRRPGAGYGEAMAEALNALLRELPLADR